MGIIQTILSKVKGPTVTPDRPLQYSYIPPWMSGVAYASAQQTEFNVQRMIADGTRINAAVFACLTTHAFAFPEALMTAMADKDTPDPTHPLQAILDSPNDDMSGSDLLLYVIWYLSLGGECYLHKLRSGDGRVQGLMPYSIAHMMPVPSVDRFIDHYRYFPYGMSGAVDFREYGGTNAYLPTVTGDDHRIEKSEIIHLRWPSINALEPWRALPPLMAVSREIDTDNQLRRYINTILKNDAIPRGIIIDRRAGTTSQQREFLQQSWQQGHGGEQKGNTAVFTGDLDYKRVSLDLSELAFDALHGVSEDRIAAALNVPVVVAGLTSGDRNSTYNNVEQADVRYTNRTLVPLWTQIGQKLTQGLRKEFTGKPIIVALDTQYVNALSQNQDALHLRAREDYIKDLVTLNEARAMIGLDSLGPDGDKFYTVTRMSITSAATAQQQATITGDQALADQGPPLGSDGLPLVPVPPKKPVAPKAHTNGHVSSGGNSDPFTVRTP